MLSFEWHYESPPSPSQTRNKTAGSKARLPGKFLPRRVAVTPILGSPGTGMERRSEGIVHPGSLGPCREDTLRPQRRCHTNLINSHNMQAASLIREEKTSHPMRVSYPLQDSCRCSSIWGCCSFLYGKGYLLPLPHIPSVFLFLVQSQPSQVQCLVLNQPFSPCKTAAAFQVLVSQIFVLASSSCPQGCTKTFPDLMLGSCYTQTPKNHTGHGS